jgi:hypothetical protein
MTRGQTHDGYCFAEPILRSLRTKTKILPVSGGSACYPAACTMAMPFDNYCLHTRDGIFEYVPEGE